MSSVGLGLRQFRYPHRGGYGLQDIANRATNIPVESEACEKS